MGTSRPPHSIADTPRGPGVGPYINPSPQPLPFGKGWAPINLAQTPRGRGP